MAATKPRPSRKSEPTHPSVMSPRVAVPKPTSGWEFPLSREEKKQRVMYLFQAELAGAEKSSAQNLEALQSLLEKRTVEPSAKVESSTTMVGSNAASTGAQHVRRARLEGLSLGVLAALGVVVIAWLCHAQTTVAMAPTTVVMHETVNSPLLSDVEGLPPPNMTDRAQGMRHEGHIRLQLSNCPEAVWWFSSALQLTSDGTNVSDDAFRNHILGERGFALVCAKELKEGAKQLEQHLAFSGFHPENAHLLNALGYSHFFLEDFDSASKYFELGIRADELNPIPWNNLAGARMMHGDLGGAEEALLRAAHNIERVGIHQQHHTTVISHNAQALRERASGASGRAPWIEIWNGYIY